MTDPAAGPTSVLHITSELPPLHFGGMGTALAGLVGASVEAGARVSVLVVDPGRGGYAYGAYGYPAASPHLAAEGRGPTPGVAGGDPFPGGFVLAEARYEEAPAVGARLVADHRHRVVHLHASWLWPIAEAIRAATGVPVVYTTHSIDRAEIEAGEWIPHGPVQDSAVTGADGVIVLSDSERLTLGRFYPGLRNVSIIGNGIEAAPGRRRHPARHLRRPVRRDPVVLYVGRFANRKGTHEYFEAVEGILDRHPRARFVVVGGGSRTDSVEEAARWLPARLAGRADRIRFVGWATDADAYFREADILVVPSRYEPFGMVVLEGMRAGVAIAASGVGGPAEILVDGETGLLFPPRDVPAMVESVCRLLDRPGLRRRLGRAAARELARRWTWDRIYPEVDRSYRALAAPVASGPGPGGARHNAGTAPGWRSGGD